MLTYLFCIVMGWLAMFASLRMDGSTSLAHFLTTAALGIALATALSNNAFLAHHLTWLLSSADASSKIPFVIVNGVILITGCMAGVLFRIHQPLGKIWPRRVAVKD